MARASGAAADGFLAAKFTHGASGVSYRIEESDGRVWLDFERADVERALKGRRELRYFLGSGTRGRTYLFEDQGYWFEIPINWYAKKRVWDMAPNYLEAREMPLTLPVDPGCLRCHASGAQPSLPVARNRYASVPFTDGGITCAACHGDASAHVASGGKVAMLKLGRLEPVRRDSICLSCHLEGQEAVVRAGKRLVDFRPGDSIFDYARYFVQETKTGLDARATSQWEALLQSGCRRDAKEKLTCTSCHDPHGSTQEMSVTERVAYYRQKCLQCHDAGEQGKGFSVTHHIENQDCASCHMPRARADDIAHEQVTDHRIPRIPMPSSKSKSAATGGDLVLVGDGTGKTPTGIGRDLGLAYAQAAAKGDAQAAVRARQLLLEAEMQPGSDGDHELHAQLGFLEQVAGEKDAAAREYGLALAADRDDSFAAGNLALLKAGERQYVAAGALLERAFGNDPVQLQAGRNLALVQCGLGKREAALGTLDRILEFSPDDGQSRELAKSIRRGQHQCGTH
jgi:predicted CXXCH cytochrome family protein